VFWSKTAEIVAKYGKKGKPFVAIGELQQDEWQDKQTGQKRTKLKVNARAFEFVPRSGSGEENGGRERQSRRPAHPPPRDESVDDFGGGDEVPF